MKALKDVMEGETEEGVRFGFYGAGSVRGLLVLISQSREEENRSKQVTGTGIRGIRHRNQGNLGSEILLGQVVAGDGPTLPAYSRVPPSLTEAPQNHCDRTGCVTKGIGFISCQLHSPNKPGK